ncbi:hypothetical protein [Streptomyces hygroscopicus]|uniref:hypothetical protein n=1 Tax=Streptomyces hygroscopicus TaxID=1912 RepID=UPI00117DA5D2|nr:hypothetical protein [Streptomyces hygroscopicus]
MKYLALAFVVLFAGLALMVISATSWANAHGSVQAVMNQVGGLLIAIFLLSVLWEIVGKRSFREETMELIRLNSDIEGTGVEAISTDRERVIDWHARLLNARKVEVFCISANTWKGNNRASLGRVAAEARIEIYLPDLTDEKIVNSLAVRSGRTSEQMRSKVEETIRAFRSLDGNRGSGNVQIYVSTVFPNFSLYKIDDRFVAALYPHRENGGSAPVICCREGGELFSMFNDDLSTVKSASIQVYPDEPPQPRIRRSRRPR